MENMLWVSGGFNPLFIAILFGSAWFLVLVVCAKIFLSQRAFTDRIKTMQRNLSSGGSARHKDYISDSKKESKERYAFREKKHEASLILKRIKAFVSAYGLREIDIALDQAGFTIQHGYIVYFIAKIMLTIVWVVVGMVVANMMSTPDQDSTVFSVAIFLASVLFGWVSFDVYLKILIQKHYNEIEKHFPHVLDLLTICVGTGLIFHLSIERVAEEMILFNKNVARELKLLTTELKINLDARQALTHFNQRLPISVIKNFTTTILQSIQHGTSIVQALETLSEETRQNLMHEAETRAARLPSLMVIPLVLMILPSLFIIILGPSIFQITTMFH